MEYQQGNIGRGFAVKFDDKDDFINCLNELVKKEKIKVGVILFIGAIEKAQVVVGPKKIEIPPIPIWTSFEDGRELLGIGTILWDNNEPKIHLHSAIGREKDVLIGCLRKDTKVYLIIEAIILELTNIELKRKYNQDFNISMSEFEQNNLR